MKGVSLYLASSKIQGDSEWLPEPLVLIPDEDWV